MTVIHIMGIVVEGHDHHIIGGVMMTLVPVEGSGTRLLPLEEKTTGEAIDSPLVFFHFLDSMLAYCVFNCVSLPNVKMALGRASLTGARLVRQWRIELL
ncbi:unnamed protein product [Cuscuta campestris]|uniref:Uncharacterized protein n=1 Tax=Cuscuta campestris TaxID=132261 RepID=A0A484KRU5_9ASTE|nr:unnamed protein product [Cuscuta campestris]